MEETSEGEDFSEGGESSEGEEDAEDDLVTPLKTLGTKVHSLSRNMNPHTVRTLQDIDSRFSPHLQDHEHRVILFLSQRGICKNAGNLLLSCSTTSVSILKLQQDRTILEKGGKISPKGSGV